MTFGRASALAAGLVGAMALGAWIGPYVLQNNQTAMVEQTSSALTDPAESAAGTDVAMPAAPERVKATRDRGETVRPSAPAVEALPASEPSLHARLKPLLNRGADMIVAAEGFRDGEQFATVAHAARNTNVPFVLLKHRVLNEKKTLTAALRQSAPDMDAAVEARRAEAEARSDIAALRG